MLVYIFPGQGSQQKMMGKHLFEEFGEVTEMADNILGYSIEKLCMENPNSDLNKTQYTQPALYVVNWLSYLKKLKETNRTPDYLLGHSLGEYNALLAAGAFDFETGLKIVLKRGQLMSQVAGGGMAAVIGMQVEQIQEILERYGLSEIAISNYNSPTQITLSGTMEEIRRGKEVFEHARADKYIILNVSGAFHSKYMIETSRMFETYIKEFQFGGINIPVISNTYARPYDSEHIVETLVEQMKAPVRWTESIQYLLGQENPQFEQIGPGNTVLNLVNTIIKKTEKKSSNYIWDRLAKSFELYPDKIFYQFHSDEKEVQLTGAELMYKSKLIGSWLQELPPQSRIILFMPQGLEYIYSIMGCWYANLVAVTVQITDLTNTEQAAAKLKAVIEQSEASGIITTDEFGEFLKEQKAIVTTQHSSPTVDMKSGVKVFNLKDLKEDAVTLQDIRPQDSEDLSLLIYTSGSTSAPKGVMLLSRNIIAQAELSSSGTNIQNDRILVSWLPQYHIYAICFNILNTLLTGAICHIFTPESFVKNPANWLKFVDKVKATHIAAPNFAYEYCCTAIDRKEIEGISLRSLLSASCAGEPIYKETYDRFIEKFESFGFNRLIFSPIYGLSETGPFTIHIPKDSVQFAYVDNSLLEQGKIKCIDEHMSGGRWFTSCGDVKFAGEVLLVDVNTNEPVNSDEVGEIWARSPGIGNGYYNHPKDSEQIFRATVNGSDKEYFKTGDLGFVKDEHLYIVGRLKELIIINGKNYHPNDLELTVKKWNKELTDPIVVFSYNEDQKEKLVIVQEVPDLGEESYREIVNSILKTISKVYQLAVSDILLVTKGSIPKTGSGKVQRIPCKNLFLNDKLPILYRYSQKNRTKNYSSGVGIAKSEGKAENVDLHRTVEVPDSFVKEAISLHLSNILDMEQEQIEFERTFAEYGLESMSGTRLINSINSDFAIDLGVTIVYDYSSIELLTKYIMSKYKEEITKAYVEAMNRDINSNIGDLKMINDEKINHENINHEKASNEKINFEHTNYEKANNEKINFEHTDQGNINHEIINCESNERISSMSNEPIAIIGMSGRFSKSDNVHELWSHLEKGDDLVEEITRWDLTKYIEENEKFSHFGSYMKHIDQFDPLFFNLSGYEASQMDPQQRIFLEECWTALEDSGYAGDSGKGKNFGIYVGCTTGDYQYLFEEDSSPQIFLGTMNSMTPSRIAYYLDLKGAAIAVDTACSSSLVAIHLACQSLWTGENDMAIAGGVSLQCTPKAVISCNRGGMLSPTGRCFTFDERADGFVPAEGAGVVILKPLSKAMEEGDHIYGVIRGSGINQDGTTNGITAPSARSQQSLERSVYEKFQINPEHIQMMEAHGTGTKLGDPIEVQALTDSFRKYTGKKKYCALGSIKSNLGHTLHAAGVAGVIKILLSLKNNKIPASLHYQKRNPNIQFDESPFYVNTKLQEWRADNVQKRCAAVSSFGFSGTNAHIVIEEAPKLVQRVKDKSDKMIVLSAKSAEQLRQQVKQLIEYCKQNPDADCGDMSHTLLLGRKHFNHRLACIAQSIDELKSNLEKWLNNQNSSRMYQSELKSNKKRKQPALIRYGNQCIGECSTCSQSNNYSENLAAIADLYVQGYELDYTKLFENGKYRRISLPTYPFAKESYWPQEIHSDIEKLDSIDKSFTNRSKMGQQIDSFTMNKSKTISIEASSNSSAVLPDTSRNDRMIGNIILASEWEPTQITEEKSYFEMGNTLLVGGTEEIQMHLKQIITAVLPFDIRADDNINEIKEKMNRLPKVNHIIWITNSNELMSAMDEHIITEQEQGVMKLFRTVKALLELGYGSKEIRWTVITTKAQSILHHENINPTHAAIHGFIGSLAKEYTNWKFTLVDTDLHDSSVYKKILDLPFDSRGNGWGYRNNEWFKQVNVPVDSIPDEATAYRQNGVYVIIGGAGSIGEAISEYLIQNYGANIVWLGRRQADSVIKEKQERLERLGSRPLYISADATDEQSLTEAYREIKRAYPQIHGVIQSALIYSEDRFELINERTFRIALASKVDISLRLAQIFQKENLDFMLFFSSINSYLKAPGQTPYSSGCVFLDNYVSRLREELSCKVKVINWGYFINNIEREEFLRKTGYGLLQYEDINTALEQFLPSHMYQITYVKIATEYALRGLSTAKKHMSFNAQQASVSAASLPTNTDLKEYIQQTIASEMSKCLKIGLDRIDYEESISDYGVDSIIAMDLVGDINAALKLDLENTILFEYNTIKDLTEHINSTYGTTMDTLSVGGHSTVQDRQVSLGVNDFKQQAPNGINQNTHSLAIDDDFQSNSVKYKDNQKLSKRDDIQKYASDNYEKEPIAIVGMSAVFPMAENIEEFWNNLMESKDCVTDIPEERWKDWRDRYPEAENKINMIKSKKGGFLDNIKDFDPLFFGISPREAETMAPELRLLLMQIWHSIEDAGIPNKTLSQRATGVFLAAGTSEYGSSGLSDSTHIGVSANATASMMANRISYIMNLHGPSESCETGCSSSLVALHRSIQAIQNKECDQAIVGAVNLLLSPLSYLGLEASNLLSVNGEAKPFQEEADGFVRSEGAGAVIIKPYSKAIQDGDHIYALIKGSAVAHGGKGISLTAPNIAGLKSAMISAYHSAKVNPADVEYMEAHGIGTPLADTIEINALKSAYNELVDKENGSKALPKCYVSSLKSSIGHGEIFSGLAALIKAVLAINHKVIPGIPKFTCLNKEISLEHSPYIIAKENQEWNDGETGQGKMRLASINSYGLGGVNAHIVLEEYESNEPKSVDKKIENSVEVIVLSGKNRERLIENAKQLNYFISSEEALQLGNLAYTLQVGREAMEERLAFVVSDVEQLKDGLKQYLEYKLENKEANYSVPIFERDKSQQNSQIMGLLSGKINEVILETILKENDLNKLALFWVLGNDLNWERLKRGKAVKRISVPGYVFDKRPYWIDSKSVVKTPKLLNTAPEHAEIDQYMMKLLSTTLGIDDAEIDKTHSLADYGMDSIMLMPLLSQLQNNISPSFSFEKLRNCETIQDMIELSAKLIEEREIPNDKQEINYTTVSWEQFPELVRLNDIPYGTPVFWIHGAFGGVEAYKRIAEQSERPFFGIQARGWAAYDKPLQGIQEMAAYYTQIIQTVQPEGPYHVGGFCLGGIISYEITRLLQGRGQKVETIVMVDSPDNIFQTHLLASREHGEKTYKNTIFQSMNMILLALSNQLLDGYENNLIHRNDVDATVTIEMFYEQMLSLAQKFGIKRTKEQLLKMLKQNVEVQIAYELYNYKINPLHEREGLNCYYFRNESGLFEGELRPYLILSEEIFNFDHVTYWKQWEAQYDNITITDVDAPNHMMLLNDPKSYVPIVEFCKELYSKPKESVNEE